MGDRMDRVSSWRHSVTQSNDVCYYARRACQERRMASKATSFHVRAIHMRLAAEYERRSLGADLTERSAS